MKKRVVFPQGKQREFLVESRKELKVTWPEFAKLVEVNRSTLEKSYQYEYCSIPYEVFKTIIGLRKLDEDKVKEEYNCKLVDLIPDALRFGLHTREIGTRVVNLPAINITYTRQVPLLNISEIKMTPHAKKRNIELPMQLTPELAEEMGIHLGDGFLSSKKKEYRLKGDKKEKDYYDIIIKQLFKKLYNLDVNLKEYENTYGFELYSKTIWLFKNQVLGIHAGRKRYMEFPEVIKVNNLQILSAFLRGMYDTDGSLSFKSSKKLRKYYPSIQLTLVAKGIIDGVAEILQMLGLEPYCYQDKRGYHHIALNGYARLERYCQLVGWHNQKHIRKFNIWKETYPTLSKDIKLETQKV